MGESYINRGSLSASKLNFIFKEGTTSLNNMVETFSFEPQLVICLYNNDNTSLKTGRLAFVSKSGAMCIYFKEGESPEIYFGGWPSFYLDGNTFKFSAITNRTYAYIAIG